MSRLPDTESDITNSLIETPAITPSFKMLGSVMAVNLTTLSSVLYGVTQLTNDLAAQAMIAIPSVMAISYVTLNYLFRQEYEKRKRETDELEEDRYVADTLAEIRSYRQISS